MKKLFKENWYTLLYLLTAAAAIVIRPLTGEEIVSYPWDTLCFIFMFMITAEGIRKEKLALPVFRVLNSVRSTPFLIFLILLSTFVFTLFLPGYAVVLIMLPFVIKLLKESNREKYTTKTAAMIVLLSEITGLVTPCSFGNIPLFYNRDTSFSVYASTLLIPFACVLVVFVLEAFILFRKTKNDEIYLHIEKEDYWDNERKGKRILYPAFLIVLLFGRRFNTIDLLLVVALAYVILDREVYRTFNWGFFITVALIITSAYTIGRIIPEETLSETLISILFTRAGGAVARGNSITAVRHSLPSAVLTFSLPFICALRELEGKEKKAFVKEYILLTLPVLIVLTVFSLIG
jgi:hypothetical protein